MNSTAGNAAQAKRSAENRSGGNEFRPNLMTMKLKPQIRATRIAVATCRGAMSTPQDCVVQIVVVEAEQVLDDDDRGLVVDQLAEQVLAARAGTAHQVLERKSTRLNSSHEWI